MDDIHRRHSYATINIPLCRPHTCGECTTGHIYYPPWVLSSPAGNLLTAVQEHNYKQGLQRDHVAET